MAVFKRVLVCSILLYGSLLNAEDYYWIGGSGSWSDLSHWSSTSGGSADKVQTPTSEDNVFFDDASFTEATGTITIDSDLLFTRDFTWSISSPGYTFQNASGADIFVHGSFSINENISFLNDGDIYFRGAGNHFIESSEENFASNLIINGSGTFEVRTDLIIKDRLTISSGNLAVSNANLSCAYLYIDPTEDSSLRLEKSSLNINGSDFTQTLSTTYSLFADLDLMSFYFDDASAITFSGEESSAILLGSKNSFLPKIEFSPSVQNANIEADAAMSVLFANGTFYTDTYFKGNIGFNSLNLIAGHQYIFEKGNTFNIDEIAAIGSCQSTVNIQSSVSGDPAYFNIGAANQPLQGINVQDVSILSGNLSAINSVSLGISEGWDFVEREKLALYWVGGSGNWNDPAHWAYQSGGAPGACVPSAVDDVFFDENSFTSANQQVSINIQNAICSSMSWRDLFGNPVLNGPETHAIHIQGNLKLDPDMVQNFQGEWVFDAQNRAVNIDLGSKALRNRATFNGKNAIWNLQSPFDVLEDIYLVTGTLNTNGYDISCIDFNSNVIEERALNLGSSTIRLHQQHTSLADWDVNYTNLNFEGSNATIILESNGSRMLSRGKDSVHIGTIVLAKGGTIFSLGPEMHFDSMLLQGVSFVYGSNEIDYLDLLPDNIFYFESGKEQLIGKINAPGTCDKPISILSTSYGAPAYFKNKNAASELSYSYIRDIHVINGEGFSASESFNNGNTEGWIFENLESKKLYWVGGSGLWDNPQNWSFESGGIGGACVPSPSDDVIFDEHSFTNDGEVVDGRIVYFGSMDWRGITKKPKLMVSRMYAYGSVYLNEDIDVVQISVLNLFTNGEAILDLKDKPISSIVMQGEGDNRLISPLRSIYEISIKNGSLFTNDQVVNCDRLMLDIDKNIYMDLGSSDIYINGDGRFMPTLANYMILAPRPPIIEPRNSTIHFTNEFNYLYSESSLNFNNVIFESHTSRTVSSTSPILSLHYNLLRFNGDAEINGPHHVDSLIFAAGKTYQLQSDVDQYVGNYLQMVGNNCLPISLSSSIAGEASRFRLSDTDVNIDFVEMKDQTAIGNQMVNAGFFSTDIDESNEGWEFKFAPFHDNVGFLGGDLILCDGGTLDLELFPFFDRAEVTWMDGFEGSNRTIKTSGKYAAKAVVDDSCILEDEFEIFSEDDYDRFLGVDQEICLGDSVLLTAYQPNATYVWSNGSTDPILFPTSPGTYSVVSTLSACQVSGEVSVEVVDLPDLAMSDEVTFCEGETNLLGFEDNESLTYLWNTGSTASTITVEEEGIYTVSYSNGACFESDSIKVNLSPSANLEMSSSVSFCTGSSIELGIESETGVSYVWSTGEDVSKIQVSKGGTYDIMANKDGCETTATVTVVENPIPDFSLGPDLEFCENDILPLAYDVPNNGQITWNTGAVQNAINIDGAGIYWATINVNGCENSDTLEVFLKASPDIDLGTNTFICEGETIELDAFYPGASYLWDNGSSASFIEVSKSDWYEVDVALGDCVQTDSIYVEVRPLPNVNLGEDLTVCQDEGTTLTVFGSYSSIKWPDGSSEPDFKVDQPGIYRVDLELNECVTSDEISISFENCKPTDFHIPTGFSPNGDGNNDILTVHYPKEVNIERFSLQIYDRWGELIYTTTDPEIGWDGRFAGEDMNGATFLYTLDVDYTDRHGIDNLTKQGSFYLFR